MTNRRTFIKNTVLSSTGFIVLPLLSFTSDSPNEPAAVAELEEGFAHPPVEARPQAYWMWMNGHITKQGISLDLQTMKEIGLAGAFIYNTGTGIPKGPVEYGSNAWQEMLKHAMSEAERLGLELYLHNAPGYSSTGGPWVTPEMSMQQLVWTETKLEGGGVVEMPLQQPYTQLHYYHDAFVIAYPSLKGEEIAMQEQLAKVLVNGKEIDKSLLFDKNAATAINLDAKTGTAILVLEFKEPFEARAVTITREVDRSFFAYDDIYDHPPLLILESSDDGESFQTICVVNMPLMRYMMAPGSKNFKAVKARYFRLSTKQTTLISNIELHAAPLLNGWPGKANFTDGEKEAGEQYVDVDAEFIIDPSSVVDITDKLTTDGRLIWEAPPGSWTVLRFGHTCAGTKNVSAPDKATGLEIDKFSSAAVDFYFQATLSEMLTPLKPFIHTTFKGLVVDSYEVGKQNWTAQFPSEFKQRRKYEMLSWLPAFTGRIVQSVNSTEIFLWDVRRVQADLMSDNYYGRIKKHCAAMGLQFYAQPYGDGVFDSLQIGQHMDVAMAEFWTRYTPGTMGVCDEVVSLAHGYGKKLVPAEAFTGAPLTSRWTEYPYALKSQGDHFYSRGINRLVLHVFVHQPYTTGLPGMTMGPYGTHFGRNLTWIKQSKRWIAYLTRTQYLLQQGLPVVDICYFKGDEPTTLIPDVNYTDPPTPRNLAGDVIGPDVLLQRVTIKNNRILLPDGMSYSLMIMAPVTAISVEVLNRLKDLIAEGMVLVVSSKPNTTHGLNVEGERIKKVVEELWQHLDGKEVKKRSFEKGTIYWNQPFEKILQAHFIKPDFEFTAKNPDAAIHYTHRRWMDADIYFISNHQRRKEMIVGSFRVTKKMPEIWNAETGEVLHAALYEVLQDRVDVSIALEPASSVFIIFRHKVDAIPLTAVRKDGVVLLTTKPYAVVEQKPYESVTNNFTISLWVKPDTIAYPGKGILIFPPEAEIVYGKNHTACGLSAGQNGVMLFERGKGPNRNASIMLQTDQPLEGWTHLVIRYREGHPSLFVNGILAAKKEVSGRMVHPGLDTKPTDELFSAYFEGNATKPVLYKMPLEEKAIYELFKKGLPAPELPFAMTITKGAKNIVKASVWENGSYQLLSSEGAKSFEIYDCKITEVEGPWYIKFPEGYGAPESIKMQKLVSLHRHTDFSIRHFSGTATYFASFTWLSNLSKDQRIFLDLSRVEVVAEVKLNEKFVGMLWKEPYSIDITKTIKNGFNKLEISVTNLWRNRMIGDAHLPKENEYTEGGFITKLPEWYTMNQSKPGQRTTFSTWNNFKKTDPLLESGLLGPVRLFVGVEKTIY